MLFQSYVRPVAPVIISTMVLFLLSTSCGDSKKDASTGDDAGLRTHLTNFSASATKTSANLEQIVVLAASIDSYLEMDDSESADSQLDLFVAELAALEANLDALETAEAGIRDSNAISQYNALGSSSSFEVRRAVFTVLAGTALFTYGTKSMMDWLKGKSDEAIAVRKERDDALDDVANGVVGAEETYASKKSELKTIHVNVLEKVAKTVVTAPVAAVVSPTTVTGLVIKEVAGKALETGLDVLTATKECSGGAEAPGCVIGATKSDENGSATVPVGTVDVVVSSSTMARVELLDVEVPAEGKTVSVPNTEIEEATTASVGDSTIGGDVGVDSDGDSGDSDNPSTGITLCDDSCSTAGDGECDDGGEGALYTGCALGSDCTDCGARENVDPMCNDSCATSGDGECDDGGEGALYMDCALGSDCSDCGARETTQDTDPGTACSGSGSSGAYPASVEDFNGLQVTYAIAGVCLDTPVETDGFTITRDYPVLGINADNITISGATAPNTASCNSDSGSFWFQTEVTLTVNGVSDTYSSPEPCVQDTTGPYDVAQPSFTFDLSVPMASYGDSVSFSVSQIYVNPLYGNRVATVTGNTSY